MNTIQLDLLSHLSTQDKRYLHFYLAFILFILFILDLQATHRKKQEIPKSYIYIYIYFCFNSKKNLL